MKNKPSFNFENQLSVPVAGVDEAGCGPWAGPLVAAAVIFLKDKVPESLLLMIDDSKRLTRRQREKIYHQLVAGEGNFLYHHIDLVTVAEIDQYTISKANRLAMQRAVNGLALQPQTALIDGNRNPNLAIPTQMVIKGDQLSFSIAAASILAKVKRDHLMIELDQQYPCYGWATNVGYGTPKHKEALKRYGPSPHHRQSFAPIQEIMGLFPYS
jgi:ribonuclease HII